MALADLPAYVREREVDAPRWVWDDTARWYPPLLASGVRVARCHDLRLCHHLLRRAPAVDARLLDGEQSEHWDRLRPRPPSDPALSVDDTAEHLRADLEDARLAAVAASAEAGRLGLLLAAESSGALVAAEMTYAGAPWRVDVQSASRPTCRPRPTRGARPQGLETLVAEVRAAFEGPRSTRSRPGCWRRCAVPAWTSRTPVRRPCGRSSTRASSRCCATSGSRTCSRPTAGPGSTSGYAAAGPSVVPAGGLGHRPLVVQRRRRLSFPVQVRPRRWPTTAGCSWSPTSPSSSPACSRA